MGMDLGGVEQLREAAQKRFRSDKPNGILQAARSTPRTRHRSVTSISKQKTNEGPKEARRGTESLAIPDSQGVHHRPLLELSLQQG